MVAKPAHEFSPWMNREFQVVGQVPAVTGCLLDGLTVQDFYFQGELGAAAHGVFFKLAGAEEWYRCFVDGPQLYCLKTQGPELLGVVSDDLEFRLRDLGRELQLLETQLAGLHLGICNGLPSLNLRFVDGRQIIFCAGSGSSDSWSGYELAVWDLGNG